ncbi:hypothetical protein [Paraburkholderia graminis]|uniref:Lipoprotein n=1 Tax=Paraburkholderia graminis TaxID=60548 RepID=A0ABD5CJT0_9BURK|nr:hypothetical protein [Paraburkholderia graminis]MDR6204825.1 hypothetical protein [Paraburkholderia graminis]
MKKQILGAALAAAINLAAIAATTASAEENAPPPAHAQGDAPPGPHAAMEPAGPIGPMGPGFAVVNDLEQLRRLYALSGRPGDIVAVYHDVLNKTQDPMLRHYVYDSLAREQLKPANPEQAIATLRTSLSEDLAAIDKMPRPPFDRAPQSKP